MKAITPNEVALQVPNFVIDIFNRLIQENWDGAESKILLSDVKGALSDHTDGQYVPRWLNVESIYEKEGWKVKFHKSDYDEVWESYYLFRKETQ